MAFLPQSDFQRRRNYLTEGTPLDVSGDTRTGESSFDLSGDVRSPRMSTRNPLAGSSFGGDRTRNYRQGISVGAGAAPTTPLSTPSKPTTATTQATQQQATAPKVEAPTGVEPSPSFVKTGSLENRLYNPLRTGSEKGQEALGQATEFFRQEAGPSRTYESIGGENILGQAFRGGAASDIEQAKGLVGARYAGPQGLDQQTVAGLQNLVNQLQTRQEALGTGGGLQTLLQQSVAGLTPGEARFEAKRLLPESRVQARDIGFETVAPLAAKLASEREAAQQFAEQRAQEEANIAEQSRGFLTGERGKIESDLAQKIAEARKQQELEAQQYQDVLGAEEADRFAALQAANPELAAQFAASGVRQKDIEADKLFQQIMSDPRFADVAQYDPLALRITGRGRQFYGVPGEEGAVTDIREIEKDPALRQLLYERQKELETAFDPGRGEGIKSARPSGYTGYESGEYAPFRPLYGGEEFKAPEIANYLGFDPGTRPSRENLSSEQQKAHFNNIQEILGSLDKIGESEPFRAAQILGEVDTYLEDEQNALEAKVGELTDNQKQWYKDVKKARKKARKAKAKEAYGKIAGVLAGAIPNAPGSEILKKATEGMGQVPISGMQLAGINSAANA